MSAPKYTAAAIEPRITGFLKTVLDDARFDLTFKVVDGGHPHPGLEDPEVVVKFTGPDVPMLLEGRAELLLALEQLTMESLRMSTEDHSLLCFDANDYRILRIQELRMSAGAAADRVRRTGSPFHFNPMSSRERRILHLCLRDEQEVRSESAGVGPIRQVVVMPAEMKVVPEAIRPPSPLPPREGRDGDRRDRRGPPRRR